ncbi:MAG TPA: hypothetical protein V6C81_01915 [Planktothrix sp.]
MNLHKLLALLAIFYLTAAPSPASEDDLDMPGTVRSVNAQGNVSKEAMVEANKANYCISNGDYDQAIKYADAALKISNDTDLHQVYADALEHKLRTQHPKDPQLFLKCVGEWLKAYRQEGGEESLSFHGLSIPGAQAWYRDEDRNLVARQRLQALVGRLPKPYETNHKFMDNVSKQLDRSVKGTVVTVGSNTSDSVTAKESTPPAKAASQPAKEQSSDQSQKTEDF